MTDDDVTLTELAEHVLPFGRRVRLVNADYQNGLHMLRLIWREGKRITQVEIDPEKLRAYNIPLSKVKRAIQRSNSDVGGRLLEMAETEFMVRGSTASAPLWGKPT